MTQHTPTTEFVPVLTTQPRPGASGSRKVWTGRYDEGDPVLLDPNTPITHPTDTKQYQDKRIIGLDLARGLALIGMIAVHTLPSENANGGISPAFWLAAGNAAALFATLAGIGLAFASGGANQATGLKLRLSRKRLFIRALLIFVIGVAINQLFSPAVFNILPYYGLLFLFAVLFIGMRIGGLTLAAGITLTVMPICIFLINRFGNATAIENVDFADFAHTPLAALNTLFFVGAYPVSTWFFYILVGLIIGRLHLKVLSTQAYLAFFGFILAIGSWIFSYGALKIAGGRDALLAAEPDLNGTDIDRILVFGAEFDFLPHNSWLWNLIAAPHANTALSILHSTGVAITAFGISLLLCRIIPRLLSPIALMGSMTLTLYVGHQLYMTYGSDNISSAAHFAIQLALGIAFAFVWTRMLRHGPLEWLVAKISKGGDSLLESSATRQDKIQPAQRISVSDLLESPHSSR